MVDWLIFGALIVIACILIETRITVGTKVAVMENDMQWIRAALQKWGIVPPTLDRKP